MRVIVENVSTGAEGIWNARIDPQRLLRLSNPLSQRGRLSVVMVTRPLWDENQGSLQFDLDSAQLLNLGNTFEAIIIDSREKELSEGLPDQLTKIQPTGDRHFIEQLKRLGSVQREIGEQLLATIRKDFPGELVFHEKSKKFVESPDNFWVVLIQPRVQSIRIIVYGRPEEHSKYNYITLKSDMHGYSSFVIKDQQQLYDAVSIIRNAKRLKDSR